MSKFMVRSQKVVWQEIKIFNSQNTTHTVMGDVTGRCIHVVLHILSVSEWFSINHKDFKTQMLLPL